MLQFLPMIMSMLGEKKKDEDARNQNSAAAMLGQAPTAERGNPGGAALQGVMGAFKTKAPGQETLDTIEGKKGKSTSSMLDDSFGNEPDGDEDLLSM